MANNFFRGDSPPVAQQSTHTVGGTPALGQIYSVVINGKTVSYTASGVDTNITIAAALQALLAASTIPEFAEVSWTAPTTAVMSSLAATPGMPYVATTSATGTGTFVTAATVASSGPNHWDDPLNWSLGAIPVNTDSVYIRNTNTSILYGLAQSAVTLTLLDIDSTYTGQIGLPDFNTSTGTSGYYEYRATRLAISATTCNVGRGSGACMSLFRWNAGTVQTLLNVYGTASPTVQGLPVVDFIGTHASNACVISQGWLGVAWPSGTSATLLTLKIGNEGSPASDVTVYLGDSCTMGTVTANGGSISLRNSVTTITLSQGTLSVNGSAAITTLTNIDGSVQYNSSGTCGTYTGYGNSSLDFSQTEVSRTFTNTTLYKDASINDPLGTVTFTNPIAVKCRLKELKALELGSGRNVQVS